jgi:hypothetical protein
MRKSKHDKADSIHRGQFDKLFESTEALMHVLMLACVFATFASIGGCGLSISLRRRPTVLIAVAGALLGSAVSWGLFLLALDGAKVFSPDYWLGDAKSGAGDIVVPMIMFAMIVSLVPASVVVAIYQSKWKGLSE